MLGFIPTNLANGTVRSYLNPNSLLPWSLSLNVSFRISEPPAYFADNVSYLSKIGVSNGEYPYNSKIFFNFEIIFSLNNASLGIKSLVPFAVSSFILINGMVGENRTRVKGSTVLYPTTRLLPS